MANENAQSDIQESNGFMCNTPYSSKSYVGTMKLTIVLHTTVIQGISILKNSRRQALSTFRGTSQVLLGGG